MQSLYKGHRDRMRLLEILHNTLVCPTEPAGVWLCYDDTKSQLPLHHASRHESKHAANGILQGGVVMRCTMTSILLILSTSVVELLRPNVVEPLRHQFRETKPDRFVFVCVWRSARPVVVAPSTSL